jgi:hypothetical protein
MDNIIYLVIAIFASILFIINIVTLVRTLIDRRATRRRVEATLGELEKETGLRLRERGIVRTTRDISV